MNKKRLLYLISLSTISMLCLIVLQLYWIKTSVETQQKKFDQSVMSSMNEVINRLEREEAITKVISSLAKGDELNGFFGEDSVFTIDKKESTASLEKKLLKNPKLAETHADQLRINFKPPPINDSSFFIIRETRKNILSSNISSPSASTDSAFKNQLRKKATIINNILKEFVLISVSKNYEDHISFEKIDSLFEFVLNSKGIKTPFVFDILDAETNLLSFSVEKNESSELKETPYRIRLFPNDFIESDYLLLYFPNQSNYLLKNSWKVLATSILLICILILLFYSSISTIYKQKKLSVVKNDFINNMTHELKTPIATISLACEALSDQSIDIKREQHLSFIKMISDENKRLSTLVDNVLKSAVWDSAELELSVRPEKIHGIIETITKSFEIQTNKRGGKLVVNLEAENDNILADRVHISNMIYNLLDNANKYSPDAPLIKVSSKNEKNNFILIIGDNGIGISKEDQHKVFDKFYRVSTGNLHDVKGFGLGLSYVKRIIDLHQGDIKIESAKGKGTIITLKLKIYGN